MSFTFAYETIVEEIRLGSHALEIEKLKSLDETIDGFFALYEKTGREELFEDLCPYFGVPWPAGTALAHYVAERAAAWPGKKVLELACGLALPTLVLAKILTGQEASFVATDLHPDVPEFFRRNLARNNLRASYRALDWRKERGEADIILGSDLLYDRHQPPALLRFLAESTWEEVILSDPQRPYWDAFVGDVKKEFRAEEFSRGNIRFLRLVRESTGKLKS
ncbi:MAG: hypothetical protein EOP11_10085 [Proteobacteria bacterium]|nr:MAG: hypothetical protein EOP11_10085 [Pseudomonadota bacterium]